MMKKKIGLLIVILMAAAMLCVWPLCLVRKDVTDQTTSGSYLESELSTGETSVLRQTIIAQESILKTVEYAVAFDGQECECTLRLLADDGSVVAEQDFTLDEEYSTRYYEVPVEARLRKGGQYVLELTVHDAQEVQPRFLYTASGEATAACNTQLEIDGAVYDGSAVSRYTYAAPLNLKNVLCLWAFVLMIGLAFLEVCCGWREQKAVDRAEKTLDEVKYALLAAEIAAVIILLWRAGQTEAVDWDEAWTWDVVSHYDFIGIIRYLMNDTHPALYFCIVKLATLLFGNTMPVYKGVSIAAAVCSMLLCATLIRKRWGVKTAVPMVLVAGLAPQLVFYNLNLRMYSWMAFFVLAAFVCTTEILYTGKRRFWILLVLSTLGGLYTQYFAVLPLLVIYAALLYHCIREGQIRKFVAACAAVVAAYIPQMFSLARMLTDDQASGEMEGSMSDLTLQGVCEWTFRTNIKWSEYLPAICYVTAVILLVIGWKRLPARERLIAVMAAAVYPVTWLICLVLSSQMHHFWANRYMLAAVLPVWFFWIAIYARHSIWAWFCMCVWLGIDLLSSYTVFYADEMSTIAYIDDAQQKLGEVGSGQIVLYNFDKYDTLYQYYLPDAELVWYEDADFDTLEGDYVYMISWGGGMYSKEVMQKYDLRIEYVSTFRLEQGVANVALCKVYFD